MKTRHTALPCETEAGFLAVVVRYAKLRGWYIYHTHDSRRSQPGFPDLVLVKAGRPVVFAELKREDGRVTPDQTRVIELLQAADAVVHLWRPSDWDTITAILD